MIIWAYFADTDPAGMLIMQPTDREVLIFADTKLDNLIADSPRLRHIVGKNKRGDLKASSTRRKFFPGGWTEIISGSSKGTTRQRTAKRTMADDIDAIEFTTQSEGDHTANLEKRTTTYKYDYLHINISTPRLANSSRIQKKYELGSQGKLHIKCPECGEWFIPDDNFLTWEKDTDAFGKIEKHYPETALLSHTCGAIINERTRLELLQTCKYIHKYPENLAHRSFHLNQFGSTLSSLQNCCIEKISALQDPEKQESYDNTVRGLPFLRKKGEELDPLKLMEQVEDYINPDDPKIPNEIQLLTCAVDVQRGTKEKPARLEVEVWGWGIGEEGWLVYRSFIPGNPIQAEVWARLDQFLDNARFIRKDNIQLHLSRVAVDSGDLPESVYAYTSGKLSRGIISIKGANKYGAPVLPRYFSRVGKKGNHPLLIIGTQAAKAEWMSRLDLKIGAGPKKLHFTKLFCNAEYFKQLTAEHLVKKNTGMIDYYIYEKIDAKAANEAADLLTYNYAMMKHCTANFAALKAKHDSEAHQLAKQNGTDKEFATIDEHEREPETVQPPAAPRKSAWDTWTSAGNWR